MLMSPAPGAAARSTGGQTPALPAGRGKTRFELPLLPLEFDDAHWTRHTFVVAREREAPGLVNYRARQR